MSEMNVFDEDDCLKFIRGTLTEQQNARVSDQDILNVMDIIWEWYEKNGYLEINMDVNEEEVLKVDELVAYVRKELRRAHMELMDPADLEDIVNAELQYEESIEDF